MRVVAELRLLAIAGIELDLAGRHPEPAYGHAVFGERAGLVGENDGGGAQRLHRRQPLDQGVLPRHAPHAARQRQRGHDRQAFRDCRHRQRDRRLDHEEGILAGGEPDAGDQRGQDQGGPDQLAGQPRQFFLQRRTARLGLLDQLRDAAKLGRQTGCRHHTDAAAARQCGAFEQHRFAFGQARVGSDGTRRLVDRDRLAGQRRFIGGEVRGFDQSHVGRNGVAGLQQDDIAGHHLLGRDDAGVAVAPHARRTGAERMQSFNRARGFQLGEKADQRVDREHGRDRGAFFQFPEVERQRRRRAEQIDHRAVELVQQHRQGAGLAPRHNRVRPEGLEPALDLLVGKPAGDRDAQMRQHLIGGQRLRGVGRSLRCLNRGHAGLVRAPDYSADQGENIEMSWEKLDASQRDQSPSWRS